MSPMASFDRACPSQVFLPVSIDAKSLVTSFNLELRSKLLGFNILGMSHGPTVLQFLRNLWYLEV